MFMNVVFIQRWCWVATWVKCKPDSLFDIQDELHFSNAVLFFSGWDVGMPVF